LLTGGTGMVGGEIVQLLSQDGTPARALTRNPQKARNLPGITWVIPHHSLEPRGSWAVRRLHALQDVRFTPESGHVQCTSSCLLWADFVAEVGDDRCVAPGANVFQ